jgi:hypothetical protein
MTTTEDFTIKDGKTYVRTAHYDWPEPHVDVQRLEEVEPLEADRQGGYWCAADGRAFAVRSISPNSCIATVEEALRETGSRNVYVIWRPKTVTKSVWNRWQKKWSARTARDLHI